MGVITIAASFAMISGRKISLIGGFNGTAKTRSGSASSCDP